MSRVPLAHQHGLAHALPLFLLAGAAFASLDAMAKWLVRDFDVLLVVWARYVGQMAFVTPFVLHRGGPRFWRTHRPGLHLVRSTMLVAATVCFFAGLRHLPLAEGSAISFLTPMIVVLLSVPLLGEQPTRARWLAAVGGLAGVLILLRPGSAVLQPAAALFVGTAVFNALYQLLTRKLQYESAYTTLFYSALVGAAGLSLALPWAFELRAPTPHAAVLFALIGAFAGLGHYWLIGAYQRAPASLLTPFTYLQLVWVTLLGYVVFDQFPEAGSLAGILVIAASGLYLARAERQRTLRS